jgi:hypothetical protein
MALINTNKQKKKKMKIEQMDSLTIAKLKTLSTKAGIDFESKDNKKTLIKNLVLHFAPQETEIVDDSAIDLALGFSKEVKNVSEGKAKLALLFQALKALKDADKEIPGVSVTLWKSSEKSDFNGMTLRFTPGEEVKGAEKAILCNLQKGLKLADLTLKTMTIRSSGSPCIWGA